MVLLLLCFGFFGWGVGSFEVERVCVWMMKCIACALVLKCLQGHIFSHQKPRSFNEKLKKHYEDVKGINEMDNKLVKMYRKVLNE